MKRLYGAKRPCLPWKGRWLSVSETGGVCSSTERENPSDSPFGLPAFNRGMIATGNHNFERFAALCNTLGGSQGVEDLRLHHSTGCFRESGVAGGFYPPLQSQREAGSIHPTAPPQSAYGCQLPQRGRRGRFALDERLSLHHSKLLLLTLRIFSSQLSTGGIDVPAQGSADGGRNSRLLQGLLEQRHGCLAAGL